MILTLTLNPSMDYLYYKDTFKLGLHNKFDNPVKMPGGKGINCARAIACLNNDVVALTVLGGSNGQLILNDLKKEKFKLEYIEIENESRNAITVMHDNGVQTEIVEKGPVINDDEVEQVIKRMLELIAKNNIDVVCLNGSANTSSQNLYDHIIRILRDKFENKIKIIADFSEDNLRNCVSNQSYFPDFIKPNELEFEQLTGEKINNKRDIIMELDKLETLIPFVLVSYGAQGGVARIHNHIYDIEVPRIEVVNPTGSGDSTVAAVACAFNQKKDDREVLKMAMTGGLANALEKGVGVINDETFKHFYEKIKIKKVK
ncbi:1-phosphofructokinase family hexose kinase [Aerococcus urinae]|uniref:1-phosphofructokinase family hexose kinase n=1 Tax=Aerococcus urinae TaxID=1376 RepID=UPI00254A51AC|nr:1-phosphofructokinase family hexose kinase [Aerococcus urinae]MDK6371099.1 1-phosphofructokinase family hexose kinase [Aerococcus urinae]